MAGAFFVGGGRRREGSRAGENHPRSGAASGTKIC